jgi:hypothetical protein
MLAHGTRDASWFTAQREKASIPSTTIETHVGSIFAKLGLPPGTDDHCRVLAVLMTSGMYEVVGRRFPAAETG